MTTTLAPAAHLHRYLPWGFATQHEALVAIAEGVDMRDYDLDRLDEVLTRTLSMICKGRLLSESDPWESTIEDASLRLRGLRPSAMPVILGADAREGTCARFRMFLFAVGVAMTPLPRVGAPRRPMVPHPPVVLRKLWAGVSNSPYPTGDHGAHLLAVMDAANDRLVARGRTAGNANEVAAEVWGMTISEIGDAGVIPEDAWASDYARLTRVAILSMSRAAGLTMPYKA